MKLSTKIILPIILISALLILLNGCMGTVPDDESPGYTPGTITGIIASPCCSTSAEAVSETCCIAPEYWCFYCQNTWNLQDAIEVVLTYGEDEVATVFTNEDGEFTFTNVDPGKNYVITAYCLDFGDNRPLVKDVALELIEGGSFDTEITDLVSTSLGLVVDFLVLYTDWGPEDISLDEVLADRPNFPNFPKFKKLVYEVRRVVENCEVNLLTDDEVQDALCRAAEEISKLEIGCGPGYTPPPPPPPPGACDVNAKPVIDQVLLNGSSVSFGDTLSPITVGTQIAFCVYATDPDNKLAQPLTYSISGSKDGNPFNLQMGTEKCVSGTPSAEEVGIYIVSVNVSDGCDTTPWPFTVEVHDECYDNTAPVLTVPTSLTVYSGETYIGVASATDDGIKFGTDLVFSASIAPDTTVNGLTIDPSTGAISWVTDCDDIVADDFTDYVVTVTVDDGCEPVSKSFTITLDPEKCDILNYLLIRGYNSASGCTGLQETLEITTPPAVPHYNETGLWLYDKDHTPNVKHINFIARFDSASTVIEYRYRYQVQEQDNPVFPDPEPWVDWSTWSSSGTNLGENTYGYGFESDCMQAPSKPSNPANYCYQFELEIRVNGNTNTYLVHVD